MEKQPEDTKVKKRAVSKDQIDRWKKAKASADSSVHNLISKDTTTLEDAKKLGTDLDYSSTDSSDNSRAASIISSGMSEYANSAINLADNIKNRDKEKDPNYVYVRDKTSDIMNGIEASVAGVALVAGLSSNLFRVPRLVSKLNTGANVVGTVIDAGQTAYNFIRGNKLNTIINAAQAGVGVIGTVGASNILTRYSRLQGYGNIVDKIFDTTGYIGNGYDIYNGISSQNDEPSKFANGGLAKIIEVVNPGSVTYQRYVNSESPMSPGIPAPVTWKTFTSRGLEKEKARGETRREIAYNYYLSKGYSHEVTAGIVGNLMQESYNTLDPTATNSIGAFGIAQWLGDRKKALFEFAKSRGTNASDFQTQLDFTDHELHTTEKKAYDALMGATSVEDATHIFNSMYERSGEDKDSKGFANRLGNAMSVYRSVGNMDNVDADSWAKSFYNSIDAPYNSSMEDWHKENMKMIDGNATDAQTTSSSEETSKQTKDADEAAKQLAEYQLKRNEQIQTLANMIWDASNIEAVQSQKTF